MLFEILVFVYDFFCVKVL